MTFWKYVTSQTTLFYVDIRIDQIPFRSPCIDINTDIGFAFKQRIKIGYILLPGDITFPFGDIDRTTFTAQRIIIIAIVSYTERSHETHQLHCG